MSCKPPKDDTSSTSVRDHLSLGRWKIRYFLQYLLGKYDDVSFLCLLDAVVEVHLGSPKGIPITKLNNTTNSGYNFYLLSYKQMVSYEARR